MIWQMGMRRHWACQLYHSWALRPMLVSMQQQPHTAPACAPAAFMTAAHTTACHTCESCCRTFRSQICVHALPRGLSQTPAQITSQSAAVHTVRQQVCS